MEQDTIGKRNRDGAGGVGMDISGVGMVGAGMDISGVGIDISGMDEG